MPTRAEYLSGQKPKDATPPAGNDNFFTRTPTLAGVLEAARMTANALKTVDQMIPSGIMADAATRELQQGGQRFSQALDRGEYANALGQAVGTAPRVVVGAAQDLVTPSASVPKTLGDFFKGLTGFNSDVPLLEAERSQQPGRGGNPRMNATLSQARSTARSTLPVGPQVKKSAADRAFDAFVKANGGKSIPNFLAMELMRSQAPAPARVPVKEQAGEVVMNMLNAEAEQFEATKPTPDQYAAFRKGMLAQLMALSGVDTLQGILPTGTEE